MLCKADGQTVRQAAKITFPTNLMSMILILFLIFTQLDFFTLTVGQVSASDRAV